MAGAHGQMGDMLDRSGLKQHIGEHLCAVTVEMAVVRTDELEKINATS
jgi:hypothetical protein